MDFNAYMEAIRAQISAEAGTGVMTLGELTARLEPLDPEMPVLIDDTSRYAGDLDSYRGYYEMLAIDPTDRKRTVRDLLKECLEAHGKTFMGYKGGDFVMTRDTPVWVSPYGEASGLAVVAVDQHADEVFVLTEEVDK